MTSLLLIVGLGNPGLEYWWTRHNLGWCVACAFAKKFGVSFERDKESKGKVASFVLDPETKVEGRLLLPNTYMNLSGRSIRRAINKYRVPADRICVVCDDVHLDFGQMRLSERGGHGGHNGLRDIEVQLGTREYVRLKIGIGEGTGVWADHVLNEWTLEEKESMPKIWERGVFILEEWCRKGITLAQRALSQLDGGK